MENQTGTYSFTINGKEWHFKFGMNAYKILFEDNNFLELLTTNKLVSAMCLAFFAGAKSLRRLNNLPTDWALEDASDVVEVSEDEQINNEIFLSCMDCLGFMYRTAGAKPETVRIMTDLAKQVREVIREKEAELSTSEPSNELLTKLA
jgi:hypothetical protein